MKSQINIGIIGLGTVGSGTLRILIENEAEIERKVGSRLAVTRIADLDVSSERPVAFDRGMLTTDVDRVLEDPDIDIVVELIGGVNPAKDFILRALRNGKHVVTANKELIAKEGADILTEAAERRLDFYFEGSVGGGIPIIHPLKACLAANSIQEVIGIVNGTTNYILTKMTREGRAFHEVLVEAQEAGYAEADPTSDVEGFDAKYKLAILASIAFTTRVNLDDVYSEGISRVTPRDIDYARELGYVVKLVAIAKRSGDTIEARVHPTLIPATHPLAAVGDVYNAIYVRGDFAQDVMFYGRGAGSLPTGSAVVGDIMDIARNINSGSTGRLPCTCYDDRRVKSIEDVVTRYYIRMLVSDRPGVLASIARVFGDNEVSIASVMQKDLQGDKAEIMMVTHQVAERNFRRAMDSIASLPVVSVVGNWIRVED